MHQISAEEYNHVISHLMSDGKFVCHAWCYNVPMAALFFVVLFCLSVTLAPVIEEHVIYIRYKQQSNDVMPMDRAPSGSVTSRSMFRQTGLEFLHGVIFWLCVLAVYLIVVYIAKSKVRAACELNVQVK